jgi:hypothetical protein
LAPHLRIKDMSLVTVLPWMLIFVRPIAALPLPLAVASLAG